MFVLIKGKVYNTDVDVPVMIRLSPAEIERIRNVPPGNDMLPFCLSGWSESKVKGWMLSNNQKLANSVKAYGERMMGAVAQSSSTTPISSSSTAPVTTFPLPPQPSSVEKASDEKLQGLFADVQLSDIEVFDDPDDNEKDDNQGEKK